MSICNRLDLQTLGSQPVIVPKNAKSRDHEVVRAQKKVSEGPSQESSRIM